MKRLLVGATFAILLVGVGIFWAAEKSSTPPVRVLAISPLYDGPYTISGVKFTVKSGFPEAASGFLREANTARMKLGTKRWNWVKTVYGDGNEVKPARVNRFTISFQGGQKFSAGTDCNSVAGSYFTLKRAITFKDLVSTQMFCSNSQEREFVQMLNQTQSYFFTPKGQLIFNLKYKKGSFIFK